MVNILTAANVPMYAGKDAEAKKVEMAIFVVGTTNIPIIFDNVPEDLKLEIIAEKTKELMKNAAGNKFQGQGPKEA